jgi:hypothetical protein
MTKTFWSSQYRQQGELVTAVSAGHEEITSSTKIQLVNEAEKNAVWI